MGASFGAGGGIEGRGIGVIAGACGGVAAGAGATGRGTGIATGGDAGLLVAGGVDC